MRSSPDQLGIAIHQTHSPVYEGAPQGHLDRTDVTSTKEKRKKNINREGQQLQDYIDEISSSPASDEKNP